MLTEQQARERANRWLAHQSFEVSLKAGRAVETEQSWIFESVPEGGEVVFGNVPVCVSKKNYRVEHCRDAWREFGDELSAVDRLKRWWHRGRSY